MNGPNQGDSIQQWYKDMPIVTKILFTGTFLSGALISFGLLDPSSIILSWPYITDKFQIWRLVSNFFFAGKFSINFVMHLYIVYQNSIKYERNPFNTGAGGTSSDYLYMLFIGMALLLLASYFMPLMVLSESLLYMITYVWSRREPESLVNIYGFTFQGVYLPWIYLGLRLIMGSTDFILPILGLFQLITLYFCMPLFNPS